MFDLPQRSIHYKGGMTLVHRNDDPTYQCTKCYKPWFDDEIHASPFLAKVECPKCSQALRKITEDKPLITN